MKIELQNITKSYSVPETDVIRDVLKNISLTISKGDTFGFVGPSGSGKSTLLNIIGTLDSPSSGKLFFDEKDSLEFTPNKLAELRNKKLGFIFQMHHLLPQLNVIENVLVPTIPIKDKIFKKEAFERARVLLDQIGLMDKITHLPSQMSVGECQRTAVVRALINEPEIILADEPTGSLDSENAEILGEMLVKLSKSDHISLIIVTHSMDLARKTDKIFELKTGKLNPI